MKDWRTAVDAAFVVTLALTATITLCGCRTGEAAVAELNETTCQATTAATVEETTEYITEPIQETEPVTEATEPQETKAPVTLYDVPLDEELQKFIIERAEMNGIDPAIIFAMAYRESTYNPEVIGDGGNSYGLLQIQPRWHEWRMEQYGCDNLLDPYQNVIVGVDYLAELLDRYDGDIAKALVGYNQGSYKGTVTSYANAVLAKAEELRGTTYVSFG